MVCDPEGGTVVSVEADVVPAIAALAAGEAIELADGPLTTLLLDLGVIVPEAEPGRSDHATPTGLDRRRVLALAGATAVAGVTVLALPKAAAAASEAGPEAQGAPPAPESTTTTTTAPPPPQEPGTFEMRYAGDVGGSPAGNPQFLWNPGTLENPGTYSVSYSNWWSSTTNLNPLSAPFGEWQSVRFNSFLLSDYDPITVTVSYTVGEITYTRIGTISRNGSTTNVVIT
jgi:hypothetical protein